MKNWKPIRPTPRCRHCDREFQDCADMLKVEAGICNRRTFLLVDASPMYFCHRRCLAEYHMPGRGRTAPGVGSSVVEKETANKKPRKGRLRLR